MGTFLLCSSMLLAQKTITGKVTGTEDGSALPGVTVAVKGTTTGTITDLEGNYKITVPAGSNTLVFTFVGMKTQEVEIGTKTSVDVALEPSATQLEGVVVTALGISREKKSLGYAVQDVKGEELTKAKENNIVNSLSGKVSGIQVTNSSGGVGASSRIVIRGATSLNKSTEPLFVVDGVPVNNKEFGSGDGFGGANRGNGAADINPDDIESVTVLKGANAAAMYGSQAGNGVILITTKSGSLSSKKGKSMGIEVGNSTMFEKPLRLPDYQDKFGQGAEGVFSYVDGAGGGIKDGVDESWGPKLDVGLMIPQYNSPKDGAGNYTPTPWISAPDNVKDFLETGVTTTTNFALQAGTNTANFRLGYTNLYQKGMLPNTNYKKNTINIGGVASPVEKLTINGNVSYVMANSDNMPSGGYDAQNVMQQFIWAARQVYYPDLKNYTNPDGSKYNWNYNFHNNPYFTLYENLNTIDRDRITGSTKISYQVLKNLNVFLRTGMDAYNNLNTARAAWGDMDNPYGYYNEQLSTFKQITNDFIALYDTKFSEDFTLNATFGGTRRNETTHLTAGYADELAIKGLYTIANSKIPIVSTSRIERKAVNSLYASASLGYKSALYFDVTFRNDWSSTLPAENNSYPYPSFSLSSIFTDLLKMESKTLTYAKARISWAQVGNDTDPYKLLPIFAFGSPWSGGEISKTLTVPNTLPNSTLKPEKTTSIEGGIELKFFMNRVSLDMAYYNNKTIDQLLTIPVSAASGYLAKSINAGRVDNDGIEITLGATPFESANGFNWTINFNFAKNNNEVVELTDGVEQIDLGTYWDLKVIAKPGEPMGVLWGADFARDENGNIIHENGVPVQGDPTNLGNYQPDFTGGINNEFSFKKITASFLVDVHKGGSIYCMTNSWGRYAGALEESLIGREGGIVGVGVKDDGTGKYVTNDVVVTAEEYNHAAFANNIPGGSIFDATYIKLREVKVGYTIKKIAGFSFKGLDIALVGRNLALLFSKIPHVDPETSFNSSLTQGIEFGQIPSARSFGFNVSVKL